MSEKAHTCMTCKVSFAEGDLQRDHYKTDWHRYNLKRKVAEMAPVTLEVFRQKMSTHEEQMKMLSGEIKEPTGYCVCCRKSFNNMRAYDNHVASKKHKEIAAKFDKKENKEEIEANRLNRKSECDDDEGDDGDMEVEEVDSDEWEDDDEEGAERGESVPPTDCLFCSHPSGDLEKNLIHMTEKHSFFLPDPEYLADLEGMVAYLGEKIGEGFMCLLCNERSKAFRSLSAAQKHMVDKGHCRINHEGDALLEYSAFYDYSKSYPDGDGEEEDADAGDNDDDEESVEVDRLDDTGYELVLPSGAKIGHRSLMRYYKQSLNPDRRVATTTKPMNKVLSHYRAHGWTGLTGAEAKRKARDLKFAQRAHQKYHMKLGVKANKLQRHFVDPTGP